MLKKLLIIISILVLLLTLYLIEFSKIKKEGVGNRLSLDNLKTDESSKNWDLFYKVRAKIIDGQSADFTIPHALKDKVSKELTLTGAVVFFGNGCEMIDNNTTKIKSFRLLPTLGLAQSCVLQPDEAMRWTIMVNLAEPWVLTRTEMINAEAIVVGKFKIDTSQPYNAAFYIENARAKLKN